MISETTTALLSNPLDFSILQNKLGTDVEPQVPIAMGNKLDCNCKTIVKVKLLY